MNHPTVLRRLLTLCVLGLAAASPLAWAQSLPVLLESARGHDAAFLAARAQFDSARFRMEQAKALRRPGLSADSTVGRSESSTPFSPSITGSQWLGLSAPKSLPAPIAQRLTALIPEILAKPDIAARLEDIQTLPRKTPVVGDEFVKLIQSQISSWTAVAKRAKVEVIT